MNSFFSPILLPLLIYYLYSRIMNYRLLLNFSVCSYKGLLIQLGVFSSLVEKQLKDVVETDLTD